MWAKTWPGIVLLVYVPAAILMYGEMRKLIAYWRLTMPKNYRLFGYRPKLAAVPSLHTVRYVAAGLAVALVGASAVFALPVYAMLGSNTVALAPNTLTVAANPNPPPPACTNNTNVNVSSTSSQSASSGSANNSGTTTGGNATSGNASNSNSTDVNITVTNGC
jgi:hypothetical protein